MSWPSPLAPLQLTTTARRAGSRVAWTDAGGEGTLSTTSGGVPTRGAASDVPPLVVAVMTNEYAHPGDRFGTVKVRSLPSTSIAPLGVVQEPPSIGLAVVAVTVNRKTYGAPLRSARPIRQLRTAT